jgi:hypothetical protein
MAHELYWWPRLVILILTIAVICAAVAWVLLVVF